MSYTIPKESQEAIDFVKFLRLSNLRFCHIPNETGVGGRLGFAIARKKKREGMQGGFPDYLVFLKKKIIAVELKRQRKILKSGKMGASPSSVEPEQEEWIEFLNTLPYCEACICFGCKEAYEVIRREMTGGFNNTK